MRPTNDQLLSERVRLFTFHDDTFGYSPNAAQYARDGFYHTGITILMKCRFCNIIFNSNRYTEITNEIHRENSPDCPLMRGFYCGNIPRDSLEIPTYYYDYRDLQEVDPVYYNYRRTLEEELEGATGERRIFDNGHDVADDGIYTISDLSTPAISDLLASNRTNDQLAAITGIDAETEEPREVLQSILDYRREIRGLYSNPIREIQAEVEMSNQDNDRQPSTSNRRVTIQPSKVEPKPKRTRVVNKGIINKRRKFYKPAHKEMRSFDARLSTFVSWPITNIAQPIALAEAGFLFTGKADHVKCYYCDLTVRDWEDKENPWVVHSYFSPKCNYLYIKRGQLFVDSVKKPSQILPISSAPEPTKDEGRYTCKICMEKEIGTVFVPCDHSVACVDCTVQIEQCPICKSEISHIVRMKMID